MVEKIPHYIKKILKAITRSGYEAYIVGGAVRDLLLGLTPGDFDITTSALPEEIKAVCLDNSFDVIDNLGNNFGCIVAVVDHAAVEITTFRGEAYGSDAHKPDKVWFCRTLEEDLSRRDFTVNAMAMDNSGNIYDPFCGRQDLQDKILRTVGTAKKRYEEDALRMLRACRFTAQLGFTYVQEDSLPVPFGQLHTPYFMPQTCTFPVEKCSGLSLERVKKELDKMLLAPYAGCGLMLFISAGLHKACCRSKSHGSFEQLDLLPELDHLSGLKQNPRFHCYDVLEHTLAAIDNSPRDLAVRWALLLHDIAKGLPGIRSLNKEGQPSDHGHEAKSAQMAAIILKRLCYPDKFIKEVTWLVAQHMRFAPMLITGKKPLLHWVRTEALSGTFRCSENMTVAYQKLVAVFLADMGATCAAKNTKLMAEGQALGQQVVAISNSFPIHTADLNISGRELLALTAPENLRQVFANLLKRVQDGNLANDREALNAAAKKFLKKQGALHELC